MDMEERRNKYRDIEEHEDNHVVMFFVLFLTLPFLMIATVCEFIMRGIMKLFLGTECICGKCNLDK
jgi:hypothetical protein